MGWARDLLFLGGYLSPAVLAEEIELEQAAQAAEAARRAAATPSLAPVAAGAARTADLPARACA